MPTLTKIYSMEEVAAHNKQDDCWIVIDGKVYDVTSYMDEHPGGDDVLLAVTGKDATDEFEDAGHSKTARELMEEYFIGELDEDSVQEIPELKIYNKEEPKDSVQKLLDLTKQYWLVPVSVITVSVAVWERDDAPLNPETRILKQLVIDGIAEANMTFSSSKATNSQICLIARASVSGGPSVACSTAKAVEWDTAWSHNLDVSGRAALGVHVEAYEEDKAEGTHPEKLQNLAEKTAEAIV